MNDLTNLLSEFNTDNVQIFDFVINLLLTCITSYLLSLIYTKYGASFSNRKKLAQTLILLSMTTMIIITIVKSSLALSLGLVGALSIVRFRTAIKEPEELAYFFLAISIGLGFGADQKLITIAGVFFVLLFILITGKLNKTNSSQQNLILTLLKSETEINEAQILEILKEFCSNIEINRIDHSKDVFELSLNVEFKNIESLVKSKEALSKLGDIEFSFIERH